MTATATQRLALTRALEDHNETLVELADQTLSPDVMDGLRTIRQFMAQLNNLANVAREATGPAVVENWVRYQMGRRETSRAWRGTQFGQHVLSSFEQIKGLAEMLGLEDAARQRQAEMIMLRRYTGYLVRWFVARGGQE